MVAQQRAGTPPHTGLLLSGSIPPLTDWYFQRPETGVDLRSGLFPGQTVVLTHGEQTATALAAQGGTGKTQLAVEFTQALRSAGAVEVLIWVTAASREAVLVSFAQAAGAVGAGDPDADADTAAARLVAWLSHTERPWALILDDLSDPADLEDLWPAGPAGQVVITTRLPGTALSPPALRAGADQAARGLRIVPVGGFSRREALDYLSWRLTDYPDQRIEALDLGEDLDGLPLGLAQAVAVMNVKGLSCREYRVQLGERRKHMETVPVEGISAPILATWSLAAECADELAPAGLAWPALALGAMLDPNGIPGAVLTSAAACGYIAGRPSTGAPPDQAMVRAAITNLARSGLVSIDPASQVRTVRMHPSVQAAVRAWIPRADFERVLLTAADALVQTWPDPDDGAQAGGLHGGAPGEAPLGSGTQMDQALGDCAAHLCAAEGAGEGAARPQAQPGPLWQPEAHPVLFRKGLSLENSGLSDATIAYWQAMVTTSTRLLGPAHASTTAARDRLALAYETAGRFGDAIAAFQAALADRERNQGREHPDTIGARGELAHAYASAGRPAEAVALYEQMVADSSRQLGLGHPVTIRARTGLAEAYQEAGRGKDSVAAYAKLVADSERLLGAGHPATLAAREDLADACLANGQAGDAVDQYRRVLGIQEASRGRDHPDVIVARASLASALRRSGKLKDAIAQYERVLSDRERVQGADHPDTIAARANLAFAYRSAGQLREAIPVYERTLEDRERVQGADHADTRGARCNLAGAYQQAGRLPDAVRQYERALADSERMLGPADEETMTTRGSLASALFAEGRLMEAIALLRRALADAERALGPEHPMTQAVRASLETATKT
ncbi:MAG: tetratricopeptide repeat protein [Streptosporangiaceae bacterium]